MLKELLAILVVLNLNVTKPNHITGKIVDKETQEELIGVKIISDCDTAYTDINGNFTIMSTNDSSNLLVSYISYEPDTIKFLGEKFFQSADY
jgi:hypothetical protein